MTTERAEVVAFVIGPIGDEGADIGTPERETYERALEVLKKVIEPACASVGVRAVRADDMTTPGELTDQVIRKLRDSDVVIADLSDGNPNVMYELGLRHSIAAITIPIAERRPVALPFDVSSVRTVLFNRDKQGLIDARRNLEATLKGSLENGDWEPVRATRIWLQDQASPALTPTDEPLATSDDQESPGVIDMLDDMEQATPRMTAAMVELTEVTTEMTEITRESTARTEKSDASGRGMAGRVAILTEYARSIDPLVVRVDTISRTLTAEADAIEPGLKYLLSRFESGAEDKNTEQAIALLEAIKAMGESVPIESTMQYQTSLAGVENLSRIVRPKIRLLRSSLDRNLEVFERIKGWGEAAASLLYEDA